MFLRNHRGDPVIGNRQSGQVGQDQTAEMNAKLLGADVVDANGMRRGAQRESCQARVSYLAKRFAGRDRGHGKTLAIDRQCDAVFDSLSGTRHTEPKVILAGDGNVEGVFQEIAVTSQTGKDAVLMLATNV